MTQSILSKFTNIVFPPYCVICLRYQTSEDLFSFVCARCFLTIREALPFLKNIKPLDRIVFYGFYNDPLLRALIFHFKYRFVNELAAPLGELLVHALTEGGVETLMRGEKPVVTFIPLSPLRERWRGFNQSSLLAHHIGSYFHLPVLPLLTRPWLTPSQANISKEAVRKKNVKGSFRLSVSKNLPPPLKILLVDDVYTSGATLKEASRVLKTWGVKTIWGITISGKT